MSVPNKNDPLSQAFTTYPSTASSEIVFISTRPDNRTGKRIVVWNDVLRYFRHARAVKNGKDSVLFLPGADLKDHCPLRIAHHPGVVLEVVNSADNTTSETSTYSEGDVPGMSQSLVLRSRDYSTTSSCQNESKLLAITSGQEMDEESDLQEQLRQQVQWLQLQVGVMRRQIEIQNRVQVLLFKNYEFHRNPLPRLFIILPKPRDGDKPITSPDQFRLYFLCECGTHTMTNGYKNPHEIHMAIQKGYDLEQPREFIEKYRVYILTMMYAVKYGSVTTNISVPPLVTTKIMDGFKSVLKHLGYLDRDIGFLVDDTIRFLHDIKDNDEPARQSHTQQSEFDKLKDIERVDLNMLKSHVNIKNDDRTLGKLFRTVNPEGHVNWVCLDHYRSKYRDSNTGKLRDFVEANGGTFVAETGKVTIKLRTSTLAAWFYDAMAQAQGIQELEVVLMWNANKDELQALTKAVTKANVISLTVDGSYLDYFWRDIVSWDFRLDPIIHLASNGRIQSLRMVKFKNFFVHSSNSSSIVMAPRLRLLSIDGGIPFKEYSKDLFLSAILDNYSALTELDLHLEERYRKDWSVTKVIRKLADLEVLKLDYEHFSTRVVVSRGTVQSAEMRVVHLCTLISQDIEFACEGHLDKLEVEYTPQESDEGKLNDIVRLNPGIKSLEIGCRVSRATFIINIVISTREKAIQNGNKFAPCVFKLKEERLIPLDWRRYPDYDRVATSISFPANSSDYTMRSEYIMYDSHGYWDFILKYGWSVVNFRTNSAFCDRHVELLNVVTELKGSNLYWLDLNISSLSDSGRECLGRVLGRSKLDKSSTQAWARKWKFKVDGLTD
ncbi:MAG: hypothetical protein J3Q66DRAFT_397206 [Benniella sp.]|nr:MAG: hypothetical protein J3Q66DRAFT_397206 [Benniella sp.]